MAAEARRLDPAGAVRDARGDLLWYDVADLDIEGMGWADTEGPYERLPARAKGVVREEVWSLGRCSAGVCTRFVTDAERISARWTLTSDSLSMHHMPATGVSGLDLYARRGGEWRWLGLGRPLEAPTNEAELAATLRAGTRAYLLYLPLYNGVSKVELGIPRKAAIFRAPARRARSRSPVVFYGTSIVQGGCASRPGMAYPAILGRWLDITTINLGFSGSARMEPEVGRLVAELDPVAFVLDCLPNVDEPLVRERTVALVRTLREARPRTPIVLVENLTFQDAYLVQSRRARYTTRNREYRRAYEILLRQGMRGLSYVQGDTLIGEDGEATVDGTHPTDLGFLRIAKALAPVLRRVLRL